MTRRITRRTFLESASKAALAGSAVLGGVAAACGEKAGAQNTGAKEKISMQKPESSKMPVLFVGHGSPMNAFVDNEWSRGFASLSAMIPKPRAILAISAHWYVQGTFVTGNVAPKTIHDFYGFPKYMYEIEYPAPGHVDLAQRVQKVLAAHHSEVSDDWGLDHGTWSVLKHVYPDAKVPVVQLSINNQLTPTEIYEMTRSLSDLRHDNVLIFASGNITHNLRDALQRMQRGDNTTPQWAKEFDENVVKALQQRDHQRLVELAPGTDAGRLSHPTPDHWLPFIYALGATDKDDRISFPIEGFDGGSLSMRSVLFS